MREGQVTNSKFPALKHLICSTLRAETLSKVNVLKLKIWSWLLDPHAYSYMYIYLYTFFTVGLTATYMNKKSKEKLNKK